MLAAQQSLAADGAIACFSSNLISSCLDADRAPQLKATVRRLVKPSMESLTYETLVPRLVEALPEVPMDPDSVADNLAYLVFNDLMRFVNTAVEASANAPLLAKIFRFIEEVAQTKDVQVQDVLQDALYGLAVAPTDGAKRYMGPNTLKVFRHVEAQIYQR
jgi:hypothetical protein